jgi:hypothetical protein
MNDKITCETENVFISVNWKYILQHYCQIKTYLSFL